MKDFGYDVADYCDVDPIFGTLEDFDRLLKEAHALGLKVLIDLVPNHTSDQHPWFLESRSSRDNPKRDWYIWKDPGPDGGPPNNWQSFFGGPAWTLDEYTGQYYLHLFLPEQPDLNWQNPEVREAIHEAMRFWLRRGWMVFGWTCFGFWPRTPSSGTSRATPPGGQGFPIACATNTPTPRTSRKPTPTCGSCGISWMSSASPDRNGSWWGRSTSPSTAWCVTTGRGATFPSTSA